MKRILITIGVILICLFGKSQYNKEIIIEQILKTDSTTIGQKIIYPDFNNCEVTMLKITIIPGKSTGWHKRNFPVFAYVLKGTLTVEIENKNIIVFPENSSFSEVIGTYHNGSNRTDENVILLAFYMGEKGVQLSEYK